MTATKPDEIANLEDRFATANKKLGAAVDAYAKVGGEEFKVDIDKLKGLSASMIAVNTRILASKHSAPGATLALIKGEGKDVSHDTIAQADLL